MALPVALPFIMSGVGAATNLLAQNRLRKQSKEALGDLRSLNKQSMSQYDDLIGMVEGRDTLTVDRSLFDAYEQFARDEAIASGGRAIGDEQMRDSVRQSSADAIARTMNVASTGADALGAVSEAQQREMEAMNQIDSESARLRFGAMRESKDRLIGASREKALFNQRADLMEFEDQQRRFNDLISMKQGRIDLQRNNALSEISQEGAVASAAAAQMSTLGNSFSSIGGSMLDVYFNDQYNDFLKNMYAGGQSSTPKADSFETPIWMTNQDNSFIDTPTFNRKNKATDKTDISSQLPNLPY